MINVEISPVWKQLKQRGDYQNIKPRNLETKLKVCLRAATTFVNTTKNSSKKKVMKSYFILLSILGGKKRASY